MLGTMEELLRLPRWGEERVGGGEKQVRKLNPYADS